MISIWYFNQLQMWAVNFGALKMNLKSLPYPWNKEYHRFRVSSLFCYFQNLRVHKRGTQNCGDIKKEILKVWECLPCNKIFSTTSQHKNHLKSRDHKEPDCPNCGKHFSRSDDYRCSISRRFKWHLKSCSKPPKEPVLKYNCRGCGMGFTSRAGTNSHEAKCSQVVWQCELCKCDFRNKQVLHRHVNT